MSSPLRIRAASESGVDVVIEDTNGNEFATTGRLVSHVANKRAQLIIEAVNSHAQQQERIEELEAALKPFSEKIIEWDEFLAEGSITVFPDHIVLKASHLRAARAALSKGDQ